MESNRFYSSIGGPLYNDEDWPTRNVTGRENCQSRFALALFCICACREVLSGEGNSRSEGLKKVKLDKNDRCGLKY